MAHNLIVNYGLYREMDVFRPLLCDHAELTRACALARRPVSAPLFFSLAVWWLLRFLRPPPRRAATPHLRLALQASTRTTTSLFCA
jgi:hypothetical protein